LWERLLWERLQARSIPLWERLQARSSARNGDPMRQRGIALIAVLWLTILMTVIASSFAFSMRSEALSARNALSLSQARAMADGAVERMVYELQRPRLLPDVWSADGQLRTWQDGDASIVASATDEAAKIDLNVAAEPLLRGLLTVVGGLEADAAQGLLDAINDWRDPDELRRPNGAEEPEYRQALRKWRPANAPFETVGELQRVLGMTPALLARIAPYLTVYSRQPGVNPATAPREVLLSIPGTDAETVDTYILQRQEALQAKRPLPPFPQAQAFGAGAIPVWAIRAEARLPDGVTFVREAVLRPSTDPMRPVVAYVWQDGVLPPQPDAAAGGAPIPNDGATDR
jgi:general secretion pathway protein K